MSSVFTDILGRTDDCDRLFILGDRPATFGRLREAVDEVARALRLAGCEAGTRVAICLDQGLAYVASLLAVRVAGGVSVLMTPDWTDGEKDRIMVHAGVSLAIADVPAIGEGTPTKTFDIPGVDCIVHVYERFDPEAVGDGDAVIIYTSGTTGTPKGVVLTEAGVSANVRAVVSYLDLNRDDASSVFTPPCYAYSLSLSLTHAWSGGRLLPLPAGMMFPMEILQSTARHRLTGLSATPTAFRMLCHVDTAPDLDLSSVRYVMTGGQSLDLQLVNALARQFPKCRVVNMYGCSENSPRISYHYVEGRAGMDANGHFAVGRAIEGTEFRVVDENGIPVPLGTAGEVAITGTSLMRGYWKDPASTDERLVDGWFYTRDLGYIDAMGLLHLTGRRGTIINIGNEKVSPEEVERILCEVEGVAEAGVYGAPDPLLGESVNALVVLEPGARVQIDDLQRHCRRRVSGYKVPRRFHVVDELPKTLYGKIDRTRLAEKGREV